MKGLHCNTGVLWRQALLERDRAREQASQSPDGSADATLAAIIMAAVTAEAFINELAETIAFMADIPAVAPSVITPPLLSLAASVKEVETERGSLKLKYLIAARTLSGASFDKGANPYQDFTSLISLRNDLVHVKPRDTYDGLIARPPKYIQVLQQRGLAIDPGERVSMSWLSVIRTARMAEWACETARGMILAVLEIMPHTGLPFDPAATFREAFTEIR